MREDLGRLVGDIDSAEAAAAAFAGTVTRLADGSWRLDLAVETDEGVRNRLLTGSTCHEVTVAGVAVLALTLDPSRATQDEEPLNDEPEPEPLDFEDQREPLPIAPATVPVRVAPPASVLSDSGAGPEQSAAPQFVLGVRAGLAVDAFVLPEPAPGIAGGVSVPFGALAVMAHGVYLSGQTARIDDGRAGTIALAAGGVSACYLRFGSMMWEACLRGEVGSLLGRGVSTDGTSGTARWLAAGAGVVGSWAPVRQMALLLGVDGYVPLVRDEFVLVDASLHETPAWTVRMFLGAEARFR